jgi:WD40 repeat protein
VGWPLPSVDVFSPDGKTVAQLYRTGTLRLFDAATGRQRHAVKLPKPARDLAFSPDGRLLVILGQDDKATVYETDTGKEIWAYEVKVPRTEYRGLAASPDARVLLFLTNEPSSGYVHAYRAGGTGLEELHRQTSTVVSAACSPDGKLGATGDVSGKVVLWDLRTLREHRQLLSPSGRVWRLAFSPDNRWLAAGGSDGLVLVWALEETGAADERRVLFKGHTATITSLRFSPDSRRLASASMDGTAKVWDLTPSDVGRPLVQPRTFTYSVAFSPDGRWLASATGFETRVFDRRTEHLVHRLPNGDGLRMIGIAFSPDSKLLATGSPDVRPWDLATGRQLRALKGPPPEGQRAEVGALAFSPDGKFVAAGYGYPGHLGPPNHDQVVKVWEAASGREVATLAHQNTVPALAFSRDGQLLATASHEGVVRVWSVATWKEVHKLKAPERFGSVAFSPDGKVLAAGLGSGEIRFWDVTTGKERDTLRGHSTHVGGLAFSPDGKTLASAGVDKTVRLWHVATGRELRTLTGHRDWVTAVAFAPDGRTLASAGDETVRLWETTPPLWHNPAEAARELARALDPARDDQVRSSLLEQAIQREAVLDQLLKLRPNERLLWFGRFYERVGRARWQDAHAALAQAIKLDPSDHVAWFFDAPLRLQLDDVRGYRDVCREMLERFERTEAPDVAERVVRTCLLVPGGVDDLARVQKLAERVLVPAAEKPDGGWAVLALSMVEHRNGQPGRAADRLQRLAAPNPNPRLEAMANLFLALARHEQKRPAEARQALDRARSIIENTFPRIDSEGLANDWHRAEWLRLQLVRRQAEGLIEGKKTEPGK